MSDPQTLVLREDEDRTVVDSRFQHLWHPSRRSQPRSRLPVGLFRDPWKRFGSAIVALAVTAGILVFMIYQHQQSQQLRRELDALRSVGLPQFSSDAVPGPAADFRSSKRRSERAGTSAFEGSRSREELELQGAELLIANDYRSARSHYEILSRQFPHESAFSELVGILRTKIGCSAASAMGSQCH